MLQFTKQNSKYSFYICFVISKYSVLNTLSALMENNEPLLK